MEPRYKPLPIHEQTTDQVLTLRPRSLRSFWIIPLAVVTLFNIGILFVSLHVVHAAGRLDSSTSAHGPINSLTASLPIATTNESVAGNVAKVELLPVDYVAFHWDTPWGSHNVTEADQLWESLNTAHGHIAIDHAWATANQWPSTMDVPGKPGKGLYLLQAYHQLHCLRVIRSLFLSMYRQTLPEYPMHHAHHCFDAIRQHIMCHADNTPLYGHGNGRSGDGQMHQCKSWTALRDYATRNTACFRDGKPGMTLEDRFGLCDNGTDGLEEEVSDRED